MKYWLLTTEYPPFFGGGISTYCANTARMLAERGHDVSVFVSDLKVSRTMISTDDDVRLIRFNPGNYGRQSLGRLAQQSYSFALIVKELLEKESPPAYIEIQDYQAIGYYLLQFKKLNYSWCKSIPVVMTAHAPAFLYLRYNRGPVYEIENLLIEYMEKWCFLAADLVIYPSRFLSEEMKKHVSFTEQHQQIIPNPFANAQSSEPISAGIGSIDEVIYYGKLSQQKGTFKLLEYFSKLWDQNSSLKLRLVGDGSIIYHPEMKTMKHIVQGRYKKHIDAGQLILDNAIRPDVMKAKLQTAKFIVFPSVIDNLPYVVMEMMAMGHIVLVSSQGGQAGIIDDGIDGFVFDHELPETFFEKVALIMGLSPSERETISLNAKNKIAANYNSAKICELKMDELRRVTAQSIQPTAFPFVSAIAQSPVSPVVPTSIPGRLTIVIPYYNLGRFIDDTITSIQSSEYANQDIVIINDGSTDPFSIGKLARYENSTGITVIHRSNEGLAATRNYGAQIASGEYLAFLDADDKVDPSYYRKSIDTLKLYSNVSFVGCWTQYFGDSEKTWPTFVPEPPFILYQNIVNSSSLVYRRNDFLEAGLNDIEIPYSLWEDYESVVSMVAGGRNGVVLPERLFHYRVRKDSMVRSVNRLKKVAIMNYVMKKHNDFYTKFATDLGSIINANGPGIDFDNPSLGSDFRNKNSTVGRFSTTIINFIKRKPALRNIALKLYRLFNK